MFWFLYTLSAFFFSYLIALKLDKFYYLIFTIVFITFITPSQVEIGSQTIAPSVFIFFYNILFEQNLSVRALRPLALSIPLSLIFFLLVRFIKKRFFQH